MSLVVPCRSLLLCDCDAGAGGGFLSVFPPPVHPLFPPPGVCLCIPILRVHLGCTFPLLVDTWKWVEIWRRICGQGTNLFVARHKFLFHVSYLAAQWLPHSFLKL